MKRFATLLAGVVKGPACGKWPALGRSSNTGPPPGVFSPLIMGAADMAYGTKFLSSIFCAALLMTAGADSFAAEPVVKNLKAPHLSDSEIIGYNAGVRPYRKSGVRLEAEYFKDKLIIHDYGHGGAGLTLSWGSAKEAVELMQLEVISGMFYLEYNEVSVIGAGVIGLTTANLLLDKGYKVTVYASGFPPETTSNVAAGIWNLGGGFEIGQVQQSQSLFDKILKSSYKEFKELAESSTPAFPGVSKIDLYTFNLPKSGLEAAQDLMPEPTAVDALFDTGAAYNGLSYQTFRIDTDVYLQSLYAKALEKGASFQKREFHSQDELLELDEVIFNCCGMGSATLFGDADVVPVKGQLVYLKPQEGVDYAAIGSKPGSSGQFYLIPLKDKIALGGTWEQGEYSADVDPAVCQEILSIAREFFILK